MCRHKNPQPSEALLPKGTSDLDRPLRLDPKGLSRHKTLLPKGESDFDRPLKFRVCLLSTTRSPSMRRIPSPTLCLLLSLSPVERKVSASLANPGIVQNRGDVFLTLPPNSDALKVCAELRKSPYISDEKAFTQFMTTYNVPLAMLNQISNNVLSDLSHRRVSSSAIIPAKIPLTPVYID